MIDWWKPWFYAGPYVPAGVLYGEPNSPSYCHWQIPGYDSDPPINKINLYEEKENETIDT